MTVAGPVAVIGAGNVGCALAADLGLRGIEVRLFNRSPGRLAAIADAGGISVTGQFEGFTALSLVTGSLTQAVEGAGAVDAIDAERLALARALGVRAPWMHLAAAAGTPAPTITALTHLAGMINGIDYAREGLTLQQMGLAGKTAGEIGAHAGAPAAGPAGAPATRS